MSEPEGHGKTRLTLLTNSLAPYRVPQWNALGKLCEFSVVLLRSNSRMRQWKIDRNDIKVPVFSVESRQMILRRVDWELNLSYWAAARLVDRTAPDLVAITGYDSPGCWAVLRWARRAGVPTVMWCESSELSSRTKGWWLLDAAKRYFVRRCDAFYVPSEHSANYLVEFGANRNNIVIGRNSCDLDKFFTCERLDDSPSPTLLFVGQLIERKGVRQMLSALERLEDIPWRLKIAGTGPLEKTLRQWSQAGSRASRVEFLGYVQQNRMGKVYRGADILVFPSIRDVYPLVMVEALYNGLYVVASDRCAVSFDMLIPGVNGQIASPENAQEFAQALREALATLPRDRARIRATVEDVTPEGEAENMLRAAAIAMDHAQAGLPPIRVPLTND
jgi:glycosyltransferase involved in cell wall biosynthesis